MGCGESAATFTFEYEGETIEVNPVFSPEQCMRMGMKLLP